MIVILQIVFIVCHESCHIWVVFQYLLLTHTFFKTSHTPQSVVSCMQAPYISSPIGSISFYLLNFSISLLCYFEPVVEAFFRDNASC